MRVDQQTIPTPALVLGVAGLIPFVASALGSLFLDGFLQAQAWYALATYGAVILSFLGGVHWGVALSLDPESTSARQINRQLISVVPSLIGWSALLMPTRTGLITMLLGFAAMLWTDLVATRSGALPVWYFRLRWPLTLVVVICLIAGVFA